MESGLESSVEAVHLCHSEQSRPDTPATVVSDEVNDHSYSVSDASTSTADQKEVDGRNLISKIKEKRVSKLTKKFSMENQSLAFGKEELFLKRKLIEKMDKCQSKYHKTMETFANSLSSLGATINAGFAMLGNVLQ